MSLVCFFAAKEQHTKQMHIVAYPCKHVLDEKTTEANIQ